MIIFIPIEIKVREFLPKLYLAYKILKYTNNEIIFGGQRFISYNIESFSNCLWFDKHTLYKRLETLCNRQSSLDLLNFLALYHR